MEGTKEVQRKRKSPRPSRGAARRKSGPRAHSHPYEVRRKAVQLCLEEGFPVRQEAREMGVGLSLSTLGKWVRIYREQGEVGLQPQPRRSVSQRPKVSPLDLDELGGDVCRLDHGWHRSRGLARSAGRIRARSPAGISRRSRPLCDAGSSSITRPNYATSPGMFPAP